MLSDGSDQADRFFSKSARSAVNFGPFVALARRISAYADAAEKKQW